MNSRGNGFLKIRLLPFAAGLLAVLALAVLPKAALADIEIGSPGTGAGETIDPRGVAVDKTEDLLYVSDRGNNRIDVFVASTGEFVRAFGWGVLDGSAELQVCTTTCLPGIAGSGPGQLNGVEGIAVDNDSTSSGFHSVYVFDSGNNRIQKFTSAGEFVWAAGDGVNDTNGGDLCTDSSGDQCGAGTAGNAAGQLNDPEGDTIEVGPGGTVYVGDRALEGETLKSRVQMYSPAGGYLGLLGGKLLEVGGNAGNTTALGVDSEGFVYVGITNTLGTGAVRKYDSSGDQVAIFNVSFNVNSLAIGPEDRVFVGDNSQFEGKEASAINEYDKNGTLLRVFYGSLRTTTHGLAVYSTANGDIFAIEGGEVKRILYIEFPPPGPVVDPKPATIFAAPIGNTKATLHGRINPENESTTYYFEYITEADYQAAGETFGAGTLKTDEQGPLPVDFELHPVEAEVSGLLAETKYRFRLVAVSAAAPGGNPGPTGSFVTKPPLEFGDLWSADVGTDTASLHAEVNPLGIPATARFEYVELSKFEESGYTEAVQVPAAGEDPIDLGAGETMKEISVQVSGLKAGTAYRFRVVATDQCKPAPAPLCEFADPEAAFTTFLPLTSISGCPNDALRAAGSGTFLPDCRGYEMVSPVDKNGAFIEPVFNISGFPAGLDQAATDGASVTFSAYKAFGKVQGAPYTNQYLSRRGSSGWTTEGISPKREGPSLLTYESSYLDRQYRAFSDDLCSGWLIQDANPVLAPGGIPGFSGPYRRDNCDPGTGSFEALMTAEPPSLPPYKAISEFQGMSSDGTVSVFLINDNLTSGLPNQPLSCRNQTNPSSETCESRVYEARAGTLRYVCILPTEKPYGDDCGVGTPARDTTGRTAQVSNAVSDDGSRIFWSASVDGPGPLYVRIDNSEPTAKTVQLSEEPAQFWAASSDGSTAIYSINGSLFEHDVDTATKKLIAEGLEGVAGASEDASRVYFASTKVLTGEDENSAGDKAVAGEPNLYLYEAGNAPGSQFRFVGTLADSDLISGTYPSSPIALFPVGRLSRVNPDGNSLAFMSSARLTGYDNKDAVTKELNMEVFLYDAEANGGEGAILCPSCSPTGARTEGRRLTQKLLEERRAASRIPTFQSQLYGARVLTDDGNRLYFNSYSRLSPLDTNKQEDVYQWSAPGTGSCSTDDPTYHEVSGGCVDLISSGKSPQGSELVDISSDGKDVFFKTNESLVTQDPGLRDIYDARIEGGFPPLPPKPIICQGEGCLKDPAPAPAAQAPQSQAPGPGNPPPPKGKKPRQKCPKGKHKVKTKAGKVRCVKNKKRKGGKAGKRANNNRRAGK